MAFVYRARRSTGMSSTATSEVSPGPEPPSPSSIRPVPSRKVSDPRETQKTLHINTSLPTPNPRRRWVLGRTEAPGSINPPAAPPSAPRSEIPAWSGPGGSPAPARTERLGTVGHGHRGASPFDRLQGVRGAGRARARRVARIPGPGDIVITGRTSGSSARGIRRESPSSRSREAPIGRSPRRRRHRRRPPRGRAEIQDARSGETRRPRPRPASRPARQSRGYVDPSPDSASRDMIPAPVHAGGCGRRRGR